jgi:hypothetical protein
MIGFLNSFATGLDAYSLERSNQSIVMRAINVIIMLDRHQQDHSCHICARGHLENILLPPLDERYEAMHWIPRSQETQPNPKGPTHAISRHTHTTCICDHIGRRVLNHGRAILSY